MILAVSKYQRYGDPMMSFGFYLQFLLNGDKDNPHCLFAPEID